MSKTPICDRWEYDSYSSGLVVPLNVAKDLETELAEARAEIEKLKKHSLAAINNATKLSEAELKAAKKLRQESSPEALESERAANAVLTEELAQAQTKYEILQMLLEAEIPATKTETAKQNIDLRIAVKSKDKLIEQMLEALKIVYNNHGYGRGNITDSELAVTAALSAAERGKQ